MTDAHGRADILSDGPGEPPGERSGDWDEETHDAPRRSEAWLVVVRAVFTPLALAVSGLVLAVLPWLGMTVIGRLAGAVTLPNDPELVWGGPTAIEITTAISGFSAAVSVLGVLLGALALYFADRAHRGTMGMGGAAVIVGLLGAVLHLLVVAAGPVPGYW